MAETMAFDLHVLGMPPAFVLSQDQTLMFIPSPLRSNSRPPRKKVHDKIPRTSFCVTSLKSKRMLHEPRSTFSPIPQSLSLKEPAPRPSPPAHPFLASPQFQTTNRRPPDDALRRERPTGPPLKTIPLQSEGTRLIRPTHMCRQPSWRKSRKTGEISLRGPTTWEGHGAFSSPN
jgi:hypothetical protein